MRLEPLTVRVLEGDVVPMPTLPPSVARYAAPDEVKAVVEA